MTPSSSTSGTATTPTVWRNPLDRSHWSSTEGRPPVMTRLLLAFTATCALFLTPTSGSTTQSWPDPRPRPPAPTSKERVGLPPRQQVMAEYRGRGGTLTPSEVRRIARAVGFTPARARQVDRISHCESRHQPRAHTNNPGTGDNSYGLMMINMVGDLGPARRKQYGLTTNEQLLDPVKNLRVAWRMSHGGRDWSPWTCARIIGLA